MQCYYNIRLIQSRNLKIVFVILQKTNSILFLKININMYYYYVLILLIFNKFNKLINLINLIFKKLFYGEIPCSALMQGGRT